jgi:hypothetical protein
MDPFSWSMAELVVCIRRTSSCCSTVRLWLPAEIGALALCREHESKSGLDGGGRQAGIGVDCGTSRTTPPPRPPHHLRWPLACWNRPGRRRAAVG